MTPFILFPKEYGLVHRDVQIVMRSGRVAQPPPVDRPFVGTDVRDEIEREDDEILRQLLLTGSEYVHKFYGSTTKRLLSNLRQTAP